MNANQSVTHANRSADLEPRAFQERGGAREPSAPHLGKLMVVVIVILAIGVAAGLMPRLHKKAAVVNETRELATLSVNVVSPLPAKAAPPLVLSGELKAASEAIIYPRTSGYV